MIGDGCPLSLPNIPSGSMTEAMKLFVRRSVEHFEGEIETRKAVSPFPKSLPTCISLSVQQEGDESVLRVRDTGVGISPDLLPRIFDLFTQAERSLDRSRGGLGIGLTLAQKLVDIHGGRIKSKAAGQGSEFIVRLPVLQSPVGLSHSIPAETINLAETSLWVLVVDDNVDAADSAAMLLRRSGHDVRVAYSSQAALEAAVVFKPQLILLDIGLPKMDGYRGRTASA